MDWIMRKMVYLWYSIVDFSASLTGCYHFYVSFRAIPAQPARHTMCDVVSIMVCLCFVMRRKPTSLFDYVKNPPISAVTFLFPHNHLKPKQQCPTHSHLSHLRQCRDIQPSYPSNLILLVLCSLLRNSRKMQRGLSCSKNLRLGG